MSKESRYRRQSVAPFVRQSQRQVAPAHGQRLGLRATLGDGANRHRREVERDHGRAKAAGNAVAERDDRNRRRAQLPTLDRGTDRETGRRLCVGVEGKPGKSVRRRAPVSRRSRMRGRCVQTRCRRRSWPHRDANGYGLDRYRLVAGKPPMARAGRHRQSRADPRNARENNNGNSLLSAQRRALARTPERSCAPALGRRKTPTNAP